MMINKIAYDSLAVINTTVDYIVNAIRKLIQELFAKKIQAPQPQPLADMELIPLVETKVETSYERYVKLCFQPTAPQTSSSVSSTYLLETQLLSLRAALKS